MSEHPPRKELVLHVTGDSERPEAVEAHLRECRRCRREGGEIRGLLGAVRHAEVPEPGADFEARIWRRVRAGLEPSLRRGRDGAQGRAGRLPEWLTPRRMVLAGSMAALVVVAFLAGLLLPPPAGTPLAPPASTDGDVRERVLLVSVGEHLGRSQRLLVELVNAETDGTVSLRTQRRVARSLLVDNRLYRQSARLAGQRMMADLLGELERVLLEVAHGPAERPAAEVEWLRERIVSRDLLFRVRVLEERVRIEDTGPAAGTSVG